MDTKRPVDRDTKRMHGPNPYPDGCFLAAQWELDRALAEMRHALMLTRCGRGVLRLLLWLEARLRRAVV